MKLKIKIQFLPVLLLIFMSSCRTVDDVISQPLDSDLNIIYCVGDSFTEGGSPGLPYPIYLQKLLISEQVVINEGHSGRESADLAIYTGGIIPKLTIDLKIPSSGKVFTTSFNYGDKILGKFRGYAVKGMLGDVHGVLFFNEDTNEYSFTRSEAGLEKILPAGTEFISDGTKHLDSVLIWWAGQNDLAFGWPYLETVQ